VRRADRSFSALAVIVYVSVTVAATDNPKKPSPNASREWMARPTEAARIARVESRIPPVVIKNEASIGMTLEQWMALHRIPGLSVAVFDQNQIVWAKAYGTKRAGSSDPVMLDTLFQAGSISKPVTAMAVLRCVEAGKWSLDENVNDKLISWKVPDNALTKEQRVTLRRLLSHSAGTTVHGFPGYAVGEPLPTLLQILDGLPPANTAPVRVDLLPGTKVRYSGGGTTVVQLMMVDQLKKPFPQIMAETVLQPLGLTHSTFEQPLPPDRAAMAASGTRASGKIVEGQWHIYPEMAAAGLWTTASDLAQIALEVSRASSGKSKRVLSSAMTKQMLTPQFGPFGLGFALDHEGRSFGHNGADEGFQAYLLAFADSGSGVAMMANSDNGFMLFERLAASVAAEYAWKSFKVNREPLPVKGGPADHAGRVARAGDPTIRLLQPEPGHRSAAGTVRNSSGRSILRPGNRCRCLWLRQY
jgi:CubicO group peptidase (beta-lactamase class C family)